jgi:hypothetical protein
VDHWQPIETAPKDGTWLLVVCEQSIEKARWDATLTVRGKPRPGWIFWRQGYVRDAEVTHWMLLPALPSPPTSDAPKDEA